MRKRFYIVLALMVGGFVGLLAHWMLAPRDYVALTNCDAIQIGWTKEEVEDLLGPPGNYRTVGPVLDVNAVGSECLWIGNSGLIALHHDVVCPAPHARRLLRRGNPPGPEPMRLVWRDIQHGLIALARQFEPIVNQIRALLK